MYCNFYGFSEKPFELTPDPKFIYMTPACREVLAAITYGIIERRGFIAIVGEVGTGKTLLLRTALDTVDQDIKVATIVHTDLTFMEMLIMALVDLGLAKPDESLSKPQAILRFKGFALQQLDRGGSVVFIVDEAQNLSIRTMENLRMLSNIETRKHKLVQIILCGQPNLDIKLNQTRLRQFTQRINLKRYSTSLNESDSYAYINHRLSIANYTGPSLFNHQAQKLIWNYSEGVPRKINIFCDNALLSGYAIKKKQIGEKIVGEVIEDLRLSPFVKTTNNVGRSQKIRHKNKKISHKDVKKKQKDIKKVRFFHRRPVWTVILDNSFLIVLLSFLIIVVLFLINNL